MVTLVTGSGSSTDYKPKLSWFSLADIFLKINNDGVYKPDTNLVKLILDILLKNKEFTLCYFNYLYTVIYL